ncbi:PD-(D/E)XK nuclease domain-containing protein [[Clostridium] innocuum]|nr:PD-(D/E)XK nuclease domain-containing protein [[Clostridium] innocuum]MCR0578079.1 PD-(D/E)XK nuclease domain-containing protein [[Clostridium] innocuum]
MIPNKEINRIYTMIFREWFEQQVMQNSIKFAEALMVEDVKAANKVLNDVLFQSISYFDYNEKFYHGVLIGMLNDYQVVSNQESGEGRFDLAVLPAYTKERGLLFEVKVVKNMENMEIAAEQACWQIKDRKYLEGLYKKGYTDIVAYGIVFCKKSCLIVKAE